MDKDLGCLGTLAILACSALLWWLTYEVFEVLLCKGPWLEKHYICDRITR